MKLICMYGVQNNAQHTVKAKYVLDSTMNCESKTRVLKVITLFPDLHCIAKGEICNVMVFLIHHR